MPLVTLVCYCGFGLIRNVLFTVEYSMPSSCFRFLVSDLGFLVFFIVQNWASLASKTLSMGMRMRLVCSPI